MNSQTNLESVAKKPISASMGEILRKSIRAITTVGALLAFWLVFSFMSPYFFTLSNILNIFLQSANLMFIAVGMTFVLITGNIDLGVGSVEAFAGSLVAYFIVVTKLPIVPSIIIALIIGTSCGWLNGKLHTTFGIPTFISTLGMFGIARGFALIITEGQSIFGVPEAFKWIGQGKIGGVVPVPIVLSVTFLIFGYILLSKTRFGKHIYAVGGDEKAARYSGVQVDKIKIYAMMFSGFTASIAGILMTSRLSSGQGTIGELDLMDAIAACVIGGTDLSGGVGSMWGTLLGVITIGSIRNGLNMLGVTSFWQQVVIGVIIILAVILDYVQRRVETK